MQASFTHNGKLKFTKVEEFLASHDLRYEVNDSSYSAEYPPLTVLKQYPAAGAKVKENRKIFVSVNRRNPPTVKMPDLIDGAALFLEQFDLHLGVLQAVLAGLQEPAAFLEFRQQFGKRDLARFHRFNDGLELAERVIKGNFGVRRFHDRPTMGRSICISIHLWTDASCDGQDAAVRAAVVLSALPNGSFARNVFVAR